MKYILVRRVLYVNLKHQSYRLLSIALDVPYIANWIYEHPGLELDLKGIWIADPSLSSGTIQREIPALRFAQVRFRCHANINDLR